VAWIGNADYKFEYFLSRVSNKSSDLARRFCCNGFGEWLLRLDCDSEWITTGQVVTKGRFRKPILRTVKERAEMSDAMDPVESDSRLSITLALI
jgi:hypothetical protein